MCGPNDFADSLLLVHEARLAAEELASGYFRYPLEKAVRIGTKQGFARAVATLGSKLRKSAEGDEADAIRGALDVLDVDWSKTTPEQRRNLVSAAMEQAGRITEKIPEKLQVPLNKAAKSVIDATRTDVRQNQGLPISAKFNEVDHKVSDYIVSSQSNFVRSDYGKRLKQFSEEARNIVASGVDQGLGRMEIASDLAKAATASVTGKSAFYWETIAAAFVGQGRSFAQMSSYQEAGVTKYEVHAVLDESTTPTCRYLNGKTFGVGDAMSSFNKVSKLSDPEEIKSVLPWVRTGTSEDGGSTLYVDRGGNRTDVAEVVRSGVGNKDDEGEYNSLLSDRGLKNAGIGFPPYHGLCRTTTLAVV